MEEEEFSAHVEALAGKRLEKPKKLSVKNGRYKDIFGFSIFWHVVVVVVYGGLISLLLNMSTKIIWSQVTV